MQNESTELKPKDPRATDPPLSAPLNTLVVRFWREWSASGSRWCCRVEHIQSGQRATVLHLEGLLDFIRRLGIMAEVGDQSAAEK